MIINHNLGAMNALSALDSNSNALNSALEKLSTGKKINNAADNASGYAISQKMQAQINGLDQASQNAQDGISLIQTASGALNETTSILQNMRQLAVQASNSTTTQSDRSDLQTQFNQLADQLNNIANTTQFNTQNLLNGNLSGQGITNVTSTSASNGITGSTVTAVNGSDTTLGNYTIQLTNTGGTITAKLEYGTDSSTLGSAVTLTSGTAATLTDANGDAFKLNLAFSAASITSGDSVSFTNTGSDTFQIGANEGQTMQLTINDMSASALGITGAIGGNDATTGATYSSTNNVNDGTNGTNNQAALDITNVANADKAIQTIDNAIQTVTTQQANLGAVQNRLQSTINNLGTSQQNLTTAESGITDVNMAQEMAQFTQDNVLQQAAVSMLAQANQQPQLVLKLLG